MKKSFKIATVLGACAMFASSYASAEIGGAVGQGVKTWLQDPVIIAAVKAQNAEHANLTEEEIIALDNEWRAEKKAGGDMPMINKILNNELSVFLRDIQSKHSSTYTEIFVMDNKGLNVGQNIATSDYWQGDEAKWQETFLKGPDAEHMGKIEKDASTGQDQAQLSFSIADPETGEAIGAITVGVNLSYGL